MSASNIVPLPMPAPQQGVWPMPPMMPVPGCCPPGGMDALMKCYCDIQAATAFICAVMVDCINTNPAVTQAIIEALQKSGSSLPLLGVTDGSSAQPGQVGEYVSFFQSGTLPVGAQSINVSMGILQAGDWDTWAFVNASVEFVELDFIMNPVPPGFVVLAASSASPSNKPQYQMVAAPAQQALTTVASPIMFTVNSNVVAAGTFAMQFIARRRR